MRITRLAPSPTGALHLGNARTFLVNWLLARQNGWKVILRIEDLDGPRVKAGADRQAIEDLRWLGLDWDEGPIYQSPRQALYAKAIQRLLQSGHAYPCVCSRKEVDQAASAPHAEDGATIYPGTCRGRFGSMDEAQRATGRVPAVRFRVPDAVIGFVDQVHGPQECKAARALGDFVIAKADGTAAYQLAVVIDDADMGVTDIVRGDDLLDSTPRQLLLYEALGYPPASVPRYWHLPLVVGTDGRRLAKRHGDTRLAFYREQGVSPQRMLQLLGRWCGMSDSPAASSPRDLLLGFDLAPLPRSPITFTPDDDRWLRQA
jgi:glutamyl-tRNA synthetase